MATISVEQLLAHGPLPPRAALEAFCGICDAATGGFALAEGVPPNAANVWLRHDGVAQLRGGGGADPWTLGVLLGQLLSGSTAALPPRDAPEAAVAEAALIAEVAASLDRSGAPLPWRQHATQLLREALRGPPATPPPIPTLGRRAADLGDQAPGAALAVVLAERAGDTWDHIPDLGQYNQDLEAMLGDALRETAEPEPEPTDDSRPADVDATPPRRRPLPPPPPPTPPRIRGWLIPGAAILAGAGAAWWLLQSPDDTAPPAPPAASTAPDAAPSDPPPAPRPSPTPEPVALEAPAVSPHHLSLRSTPPGATVEIDGQPVGETDLLDLELDPGVHHVRLTAGDRSFERALEIPAKMTCVWDASGVQEPEWHCTTSRDER